MYSVCVCFLSLYPGPSPSPAEPWKLHLEDETHQTHLTEFHPVDHLCGQGDELGAGGRGAGAAILHPHVGEVYYYYYIIIILYLLF